MIYNKPNMRNFGGIMNHTIGFPGLGIGEFTINDTAFTLFGKLTIAWYGIIIVCGIIIAVTYIYFRSKHDKLMVDDLIDIAFATIIPAIVGARLYYVFFKWLEDPSFYKTFWDVINIRQGGLAIYGGVIFGIAGCVCMLKIKKVHVFRFLDTGVPGLMIAQALGRWGNFFNAEAYGSRTNLPWGMTINGGDPVHPTFFYESLWNVIGFILINRVILRRKKYDGEGLLFYVTWYGLGRMFIEGLRTDSLYIGNTGIRVSRLLALICFVAGSVLMIVFRVMPKQLPLHSCLYVEGSKKYLKVMEAEAAKSADRPENTEGHGDTEAPSEEARGDTDTNVKDGDEHDN